MDSLLDNIRTVSYDSKIYKDQCVYCFDTPLHGPLFVDFKKFWGHCSSHVSEGGFYLKHVKEVKERPVADETEDPPAKITRLAIGVEGGFEDRNLFDYKDIYSVWVKHPDNTTQEFTLDSPDLPAKAKETAMNIMAYSSAGANEQNNQWEGDVRKNSKHSDSLQQLDNGVKVAPGPWRCSVEGCDKRDNLWMNLTSGVILCGRKYFDGSGGNNHAVDYYDQNKYPLSVKLGTITPQGGDVYSYEEDDMVVDTNLAKHLQHFGIDMMQCQQTDKTMNELEIDLNMNLKLEYDGILESGVVLKPVFGPGYLGYINMGKYSVNSEDLKPGHENGVRPALLKSIIGAGHPEFSSTRQQDAHEYFLHIISLLEKEERKTPTLLCTDEFCFEVEDRIQCNSSQQVMYKTRKDYCLSLPIPLEKATNLSAAREWEIKKVGLEKAGEKLKPEDCVKYNVKLMDCFSEFNAAEVISEFLSPATNNRGTAHKTTGLKTFPNFLMLQVRRFTLTENWQPKKLDVLLEVPETIDIGHLRSSGLQPGEVELPAGPTEAPLQPDPTIVENLMMMGFEYEACRKAAYHTANTGVETAMEWILNRISDPDLNTPLIIEQGEQPAAVTVNLDDVQMLCAMGFTDKQATKALQKCDNNLERAADWVFSHAHELDEEQGPASGALPDGPGTYKLRALISHMGTSTACGHYVCHIRDTAGQWVLYNDEKVLISVKPPRDMAYMYLYERE